ncbi:hypothetical protein [Ruegeria sp.]|uniref:hypothetical protein n=1 Tax=Ruegeria sp. TaxID=1879320 RepID=UPI00231A7395|nr:hypothetical protein [Ruegeria sp.]MDA7965203.1 hypothetical protein [Ruegeria sp.]
MASGTMAQTVRVRSGEHDGYTRLVFQIPPGTDWDLASHQNGARLAVALKDATFETDAVFSRLSAGRLTSVLQPEPGAPLELDFGCDCVATAFLHRQTMVVVDIAPGAFTPPPDIAALPPLLPKPDVTKPRAAHPGVELPASLLQLQRRGFETQLMSRLLQGADREVVDLNLANVGARQSGYFGPIQSPADLPENLHVSTILDEIPGLDQSALLQVETRPKCIADAELGFDTWTGTQPFAQHVAELRGGLFQEFDRLDIETAEKLAKLYTYFGFGAEAVQVMQLVPKRDAKWDRIEAMARFIDDQQIARSNPFFDQQRCGGDAALWAVLTEGYLAKDAKLNSIEHSFTRLPQHLKVQFGPLLSEILIEADRLESAHRILRAVDRVNDTDDPELVLAKASIAEAEGDDQQATDLLTKAATAPEATDEAPLALARLIEKRWSDRGAITGQELDLAAAYAVQFRNSESGPMMARAHVLALALNQEFGAAFGRFPAGMEDKAWHRTHDQVLQLLAERGDDVSFLRHVLTLSMTEREGMTIETAMALSDRLTQLGFAELGFEMANRPADKAHRADRTRLRARASIYEDRPRHALLELAGERSEPAMRLRAQALIKSQDFAGAALILKEIGETDAAERNFWRAGLIEEAQTETPGMYGNLAGLSQALTDPIARQPEKPLADATALLEASSLTRSQINDMFNMLGGDVSE